MVRIGYALSSEETRPRDLVRNAALAEQAGFGFALISDHFHPWTNTQGQSPFVWSVIGAIAEATSNLELGTGVTCPTIRIHPAIIAQAAATAGAMMEGRFFLGVGTGENLNEHILGDRWPDWDVRARMLREAVQVIRELWNGEVASFEGEFYTVENARLYTLPERRVPNPAHFEQLAKIVTEDMIAERIVCGPDIDRHVERIQAYVDAGYDHVYIHQVGPDQEGFLEAYARDVLPRFAPATRGRRSEQGAA